MDNEAGPSAVPDEGRRSSQSGRVPSSEHVHCAGCDHGLWRCCVPGCPDEVGHPYPFTERVPSPVTAETQIDKYEELLDEEQTFQHLTPAVPGRTQTSHRWTPDEPCPSCGTTDEHDDDGGHGMLGCPVPVRSTGRSPSSDDVYVCQDRGCGHY